MNCKWIQRACLVGLSLILLLGATAWQIDEPKTAATPNIGLWNGTTSRGYPMSFTVTSGGAQWTNFKLKTDFEASNCGAYGTIEITAPGPGNISGNQFGYASSTYAFTGQFQSPSTASGTYTFTNRQIVISLPYPPYVCYYYLTQSGTWSVTIPLTITGNAGVGGATLSYVDGTPQTVTADGSGNYSITVDSGWSGTVTPSKTGYAFTPANRTYSNIQTPQAAQNYTATPITYTISGNTRLGGVLLSYVDGTPKSVISDASGNYSLIVSYNWSGTVTPSKAGYTFAPASRTYTNVLANQTGQNYTTLVTLSGNTQLGGVTLSYTDGTLKTVTSDGTGNYSLLVSYNWSGKVTPSKTGFSFLPASRAYANVTTNQAGQNYAALVVISGDTGVAGVTLSYTDGSTKTTTSLPDGSYSLSVSYNWSGKVIPTHSCFSFNPPDRTYTNLLASQASQDYTPTLLGGSGCADLDVLVGGANQGRFGIPSQGSTRVSFTGLNNGPVKIISTNATSLIGAERVIYKVNGINTSFTEMMGLPNSQLDTIYWLPWYNNIDLDTQLRFANVSNSTATVQVFIGNEEMADSPFTLAAGESTRKSFAGINSGPVKIVSNQNIVAAERVIYKVNNVNTSFAEMMALPNSQLDTTYWLPWYNNRDLDTQLRIANVSDSPTIVHVYINNVEMGTGFPLAAGESTRQSFAGINNGPVKIVSTVPIVAAERVIYKVNNVRTSFAEMMALPNSRLDTTYWLPWYNNRDLDTQLRFANVSDSPATVHVYIGGVEMGTGFPLAVGESTRKSFAGINNGPVKIVSDQDLVVAERVIYKVNNVNTSFSEMMGLPDTLLNAIYWLPWYNNRDLDTQLRFGVP